MRTHLLRTFYPSSTIEPDTGCAANDDCGNEEEPPEPASHKALALVVKPAEQSANDEHDDYYLGGYAGI
jgi:hypothetical protein